MVGASEKPQGYEYGDKDANARGSRIGRELQPIDVSEEIEVDLEYLKDLAIIFRFIGPRMERKKICKWICENWKTPQIMKFLPCGFFIVIFATEEERMKILDGGVWFIDSTPLYIQRCHMNFNPLITKPYEKPIWICLNNLPMEYWMEEALNKIGLSLGTLIDIDTEIAEGDSYLYARLQLAVVRVIPPEIRLLAHGKEWIQIVEIEEDKVFCLIADNRITRWQIVGKVPETKKVWRPKQLIEDNQKEPIKVSQKQSSEIKTNMVGNGNRSPQPEVNMGEGNSARDDLIKKPQITKENCASSMDDKVMDQVPEDVGESEEEDGDDEINITEIEHIEQLMSIEGRQGKGNKGRKTNKQTEKRGGGCRKRIDECDGVSQKEEYQGSSRIPWESMRILSWKVRGLGAPDKHWMVKHHLVKANCDIVMLQQTKCRIIDGEKFIKYCRN
ncbi:hypothetical protein SUGI_0298390 [Cryptomeria japonica]|nr:hypothetical protein SUGI_0298390 [Cryptomeria japonica]